MERENSIDGMIVHHDSSLNISDVFEAIENTDPDYRQITANNTIDQNNTTMNRTGPGGHYTGARIVIVEQPASKAMRFRYECEGRSAGSIPGQNSTPENKTFPTIRVEGYKGKAVVVVSCVTKDEPYRPHPHNLVGKEGCKEGVCTIEIPVETMTVTFSNLGIRCVKKKDIDEALQKRERIRVDPFRTKFAHRNQPSSIDLNAVRLCFQVFLEEKGKFSVPLEPVVSEPIYDKKANTDLQIFQLSSSSSSVAGGKKVLLFCEKVTKDDIAVKFFEQRDNQIVWEGLADFQPSDVHRQVGIAFTTPRYQNLEVSEPVDVYIQLFRPSDRVTSDPLPFQFKPLEKGSSRFWSLRRALDKDKDDNHIFNEILNNLNNAKVKSNKITETKPLNNDVIQIGDQWKHLKDIENENWSNNIVMDIEEPNNNTDEKSLNDLLNQVAELDEIYSDTQARLFSNNILNANLNPIGMSLDNRMVQIDNEIDVDDTNYSSLQLAFKNPVDMIDENLLTAQGPLIEIGGQKRENESEKLPPLPPKRVKKLDTPTLARPVSSTVYSSSNSITLSVQQAQSLLGSNSSLIRKPVSRSASFNVVQRTSNAPSKVLPPTPKHTSTLPNSKKKGFFTKLFSRRSSKDKPQRTSAKSSNLSTPNRGSIASFKSLRDNTTAGNVSLSGGHMKTVASYHDSPDVIHISLKGPLSDNSPKQESVNKTNELLDDSKSPVSTDPEINLDLTEAEHYALYTAVAPHATQSEFDETSCYYAPVEGGKIIS